MSRKPNDMSKLRNVIKLSSLNDLELYSKRPSFKVEFFCDFFSRGEILEYIKAIHLKIKRMALKTVPTTGFEPAHH